jgi:hypothetical protein
MTDLSSTCGSTGGASIYADVTFTCTSNNVVSFSLTAPRLSKLPTSSVSYLIRCIPTNMAQCPAFKPVSTLIPASRYNVKVDNKPASGYRLDWQVPLDTLGCNCSTAAVAVRASGTFVTMPK